jgi:L-threonylcarbamoyladenylate synthase
MGVETRIVDAHDEGWLDESLSVLRRGGLVAFPTDTVYGLGAIAGDAGAIEAIFIAKKRPSEKSVAVLLAGWNEVALVATPNDRARRLAETFWPGPLTIILRRLPHLPDAIGPGPTVGVRAPDHAVALALLRAGGPLAVSSANTSGGASPTTPAEVMADLAGRIDLLIDGGRTPGGRPSTVVDGTGDTPRLIREGPVSMNEIRAAWGSQDGAA